MECDYCNGDVAIFWQNEMNNAFIDSEGEMMVTVDGQCIRFNVNCCPMCGRKFGIEEYLSLKKGDDIYYADCDIGEIEHGNIFSVTIQDGKVTSFTVDFGDDFDEIDGSALGEYYFINKDDALLALK